MNYSRIYDQLIDRAIERNWSHRRFHRYGVSPERYVEAHHVIPKSLGGADNDSNIVVLTAKEHYVAHHLLAKAFPCRETHAAYGAMGRHPERRKLPAYKVGEAREYAASSHRGKRLTEAHKRKLRESSTGRKHTEEAKSKMRRPSPLKGTTIPEERRMKISEGLTGRRVSDTTRQKLRDANSGRTLSEEHRKKMSEAKLNSPPVVCPHCFKAGGASVMKRWHFDNCKHK